MNNKHHTYNYDSEEVRSLRPPDWVKDAVFYQIFPDRFYNGNPGNDPENLANWGEKPTRDNFFGGDLEGIIEKLDYIDGLGANALYLNPIFKSPSNHKYDTTDYYEIDPHFGAISDLKSLVSSAHNRGIRVILDGAFNHSGEKFPGFQDVKKKGSDSNYWNWYEIDGFPVETEPEPNYRCWAGVPEMPEFDRTNPEVREYLLEVVRYWIEEVNIDGWRLDTVNYLEPDFVQAIRATAKEAKSDAYVMGEVVGPAASWFKSGSLDGVMNYELYKFLTDFFARGKYGASEFRHRVYFLRRSYPAWANYANYNLLGSHDRPRFMTLCDDDLARFKQAYFFLFTLPGAPTIYYGDEIGMTGADDPDCRGTYPWKEDVYHKGLLEFFRGLTKLRDEVKPLRRGDFREIGSNEKVFVYARGTRGGPVLATVNVEDRRAKIKVSLEGIPHSSKPELRFGQGSFTLTGENIELELPERGYLLLKLSP